MDGKTKRKIKKNKRCIYCKCDYPLFLTVDHKTPKVRGGEDNEKNVNVCCWFCNQIKGALTHNEFLKYRRALITLYDLQKIKIQFPSNLPLAFKPAHYPDFQRRLPLEKQPIEKNEDEQKKTA